MRLINVSSMTLESFLDDNIPPYAILSHTWGSEELTLQEFTTDLAAHSSKEGYAKIAACCRLAEAAGLGHAWVDTVCIDKTSSAELTEAINSMFRWYRAASVCHVWLADVTADADLLTVLPACRWFTRGWTLQEMLAPRRVEFFDAEWKFRGTKKDLQQALADVTGVATAVLEDPALMYGLSVAERMSWAAGRQTTRAEDLAYCLLGIFDVGMPLLYGEGNKAFLRLQEEIARETNDLSLFAWRDAAKAESQAASEEQTYWGVFATHPRQFSSCAGMTAVRDQALNVEYTITNKGVRLEASKAETEDGDVLLLLNCALATAPEDDIGIWIRPNGGGLFSRVRPSELSAVPPGAAIAPASVATKVYLLKRVSLEHSRALSRKHRGAIMMRDNFNQADKYKGQPPFPDCCFEAWQVRPREDWDAQRRMLMTHGAREYFSFFWFRVHKTAALNMPTTKAGGLCIVVVGKFADEAEPFAVAMSTEDHSRVMKPPGSVNQRTLRTVRGESKSVTLLFMREPGGITLEPLLSEDVVDGETVYCIDLKVTRS